MQHGMGTHTSVEFSRESADDTGGNGSSDTGGGASSSSKLSRRQSTVKWETALFGAEQRWTEAAVAIGTRWGSSLPACLPARLPACR